MAVVLGLDAGPHVCRWSGRGCFILMGPLVLVPGLRLVLVKGDVLHGQLGAPVHVPLLSRSWSALLMPARLVIERGVDLGQLGLLVAALGPLGLLVAARYRMGFFSVF